MPALPVIVAGINVVGVDGRAVPVVLQVVAGTGDMPPPSNIWPVEPLAGEQPLKAPGLMPGASSSIAPSGMPAWPTDARGSMASGAVPGNDGNIVSRLGAGVANQQSARQQANGAEQLVHGFTSITVPDGWAGRS